VDVAEVEAAGERDVEGEKWDSLGSAVLGIQKAVTKLVVCVLNM